jgi:hypothetical protein
MSAHLNMTLRVRQRKLLNLVPEWLHYGTWEVAKPQEESVRMFVE